MASGAKNGRSLRVLCRASALFALLGCTQGVELGSECPPDARCSGGDASLPGAQQDARVFEPALDGGVGEFPSDPGMNGDASMASDGSLLPSVDAAADSATPAGDGGSVGTIIYPDIPNGSFEVTIGDPGFVAFQPTGSIPIGFTVIEPWTACIGGYEAVTELSPDVRPTDGATFLRAPVSPASSVGLDRQFPEPLVVGQSYGFRIDLRSTASTPSLYLAVYGVAIQCIANPTPLARSESVSNAGWVSQCITFTPSSPYRGIVLSASADDEASSGESLLLDNLRDDPACAAAVVP